MLDTAQRGRQGNTKGPGGATNRFALTLITIAVSTFTVTGRDLSREPENAALFYYQAMLREDAMNAAFPDSDTRYRVGRKLWDGVFDEDVERYLKATDRYIALFNKGAGATKCRWNTEFGGFLHASILSNMKHLARDALGRFEYLLDEKHDEKEAVAQFRAVWNASGNFEEQPVIIGMLIRNAVRGMAAGRLERTLPALSPKALKELRTYFDHQYESNRWDLGDRLRNEIALFTQIMESRPDSSASEDGLTKWKQTVADSLPIGRNGIGYDKLGEALRAEQACMNAAVEVADVADPKQFETSIDAYESECRVSERFVPEWIEAEQLRGFHEKATLDRVRLAQITCALRIATDGPDALTSVSDPATDTPFEMSKTKTGFVLRSAFKGPDHEPVSFTFSRSGKPQSTNSS